MSQKNSSKSGKHLNIIITAVVALLAVVAIVFVVNKPDPSTKDNKSTKAAVTKDNDLVIPVNDIKESATFYPVEIDGTKMEIIAVKASDGTLRTAFNTCQVCYNSGKGYYEQEGDQLVCQNCGNRFGMDDVETTRGGCNPVPITDEYKSVDSTNITITKDVLASAVSIFADWK